MRERLSVGVLIACLAMLPVACGRDRVADGGSAATQGSSTDWVRIYRPRRASNGFTLTLLNRQTPILIDMSGRVVHSWPRVRARSRARLLDDCSLLSMGSGGQRVQEHGWDGELRWEYAVPDGLPHHDVVRLANGNTLVAVLPTGEVTDRLIEVDRDGRIVWEWDAGERLSGLLARKRPRGKNLTHINSVQELPANRWFDRGDTRFRPGNLLISARNLDTILVVDRETGEPVWQMERGLDQQHEALMTPRSLPRPGFIQLFNNRSSSRSRSSVEEIDPDARSIVWKFRAEGFFSATKGAQQALPNGNVLIVSSRGWRAFEVTRSGDVVWQWTPPFEPQRPRRYSADHCPELGSLPDPAGERVEPPAGYLYVDRELHAYTRSDNAWVERRLDGEARSVLATPNRCSKILVPWQARFDVGYGVATDPAPPNGSSGTVRFSVSVRRGQGGEPVERFSDALAADRSEWRSTSIPLDDLTGEWIKLCTSAEEPGDPPARRRVGHWTGAAVVAGDAPATAEEPAELTEQEIEERLRHLRAMGYVD